MNLENTILLSNVSTPTVGNDFVYSEKYEAVGYHRIETGIHTAIYEFNEAVCEVKLQATLELYPGDNDWFDVADSTLITDETYSQYPISFMGNFIWLRVAYKLTSGIITAIRLY